MVRLFVLSCLLPLMINSSAEAGPRRHFRYYRAYPHYGTQGLFGPGRSGVAPRIAIAPRDNVYAYPAPRGSRTGGVND